MHHHDVVKKRLIPNIKSFIEGCDNIFKKSSRGLISTTEAHDVTRTMFRDFEYYLLHSQSEKSWLYSTSTDEDKDSYKSSYSRSESDDQHTDDAKELPQSIIALKSLIDQDDFHEDRSAHEMDISVVSTADKHKPSTLIPSTSMPSSAELETAYQIMDKGQTAHGKEILVATRQSLSSLSSTLSENIKHGHTDIKSLSSSSLA